MRLSWGPAISTGILATFVLILALMILPRFLGIQPIDLTREFGSAFNPQSPYLSGSLFLGLLGVAWAVIFRVVYPIFPGKTLLKGILFGLIVGITSLTLLPKLMLTVNAQWLDLATFTNAPITWDNQTIMIMVAYALFGIVVAKGSHSDPLSLDL